jgi:hypothetical protein
VGSSAPDAYCPSAKTMGLEEEDDDDEDEDGGEKG